MKLMVLLSMLSMAWGCGTSHGGGGDGGVDPGHDLGGKNDQDGGMAGTSPVTGTAIDEFITETGRQSRPQDLSQTLIAAIVTEADGYQNWHWGTGTAAGTFTIADVPNGPYVLQFGSGSFFEADTRSWDFGNLYVGRPDAVAVAPSAATSLGLELTGLAPWTAGDELALFSLGSAAWGSLSAAATAPQEGVTTLSGFAVNYAKLQHPTLIDGGKGDHLFVTQSEQKRDGNVSYSAATRVLSSGAVTMKPGESTTLAGAMVAVAQDQTLGFTWDGAAFEALRSAVHPSAHADYRFRILAEPAGPAEQSRSSPPELLRVSSLTSASAAGTLSYGSPYPAAWGRIGALDISYTAEVSLPGEATPRTIPLATGAQLFAPVDQLGGGLAPTLGPVRDIKIAGQSAADGLTGVGATPTITWQPPATGTPVGYVVLIGRFAPLPINANLGPIGWIGGIFTTGTSFTIPAGVLSTLISPYHCLEIIAINGLDPRRPLRRGYPTATTPVLSGYFTP
jgi:hypothetical protein